MAGDLQAQLAVLRRKVARIDKKYAEGPAHAPADVRLAIALCVESAQKVERVLKHPAPICLLKGFGDNAVDLELRFWIRDPMNGVANVKSEVLLHIWDSLHANKIAFPYPQRDLHIMTPVEVTVHKATDR